MVNKSLLSLVAILTSLLLSGTSHAEPQSVAYQINQAHAGFINMSSFGPTLKVRWTANLGSGISYPIIAGGKVFVTVNNPSGYGTNLYALSSDTGNVLWGPVFLGGTYWWANCCYEAGKLFVLNYNGLLRAFDANTGQVVWSNQLPGQYAFSSAPTAYKGVVYAGGAGSGGTVYAVNSVDGSILWTNPVENGDHSSPAVSDDGVYVSYACSMSYKFEPIIGNQLWNFQTGCSGGGGRTPVLYNGKLYVRDDASNISYILDAATGTSEGNFTSKVAPAFSNNVGIFLDAPTYLNSTGSIRAYDVNTNSLLWSFAGDGNLWSAPIIINNDVFVGSSSGNLYAVNINTGVQEWTTNVGDAIPYVDEHNVSRPLTGFGAGDGLLVVPTNSKLVAYGYNNTSLLSSLVSPPGSGSIIADPASPDGYYLNGTPVGLTAAPASGYAFTGWSGDASGTPNPVNIVMDTDKTVTANFKAKRYLTLSSSTGGTCTASPDHTGSGDYYLDGDPVSITATPSSSSYMFTGWGGDASGGATLLNITMSANKTISASFALKNRIDLSVSQNGTAVTIMATMYYNGSPSSGKTLTFYNQKGNTGGFVSIGTAVTNASGVATRTYTAAPGSNTVYASFAPSGGISPMLSSSVPYTISKVTLVDPVNGAYITDTNIPTLLWSELSGGTGTYHIQVATAPTFGTAVIYEADVSNLVCIMPSPLAIGKKYYWHVYSYLPNGRSSYSDTWSFTCKYSSELSFVYLREDGYNVTFELVLTGGSMPLPGRVLNIYDGATLKASGTTLANGTMTKTITSTLGDHNFSARFSGDANDVPAATDSYPLNINKIWATSPKNGAVGEINGFGWVSCSCYTSYFVEIATASTFGSAIIYEMNVTGGGCTLPSGLLTVGRTYYWRVQGFSPIGASVWSDTSSFVYKKGATLSVVLTSQNGSTVKLKTTLIRTDDGVPLPSRMVKIYDGTTLLASGTTLADGTVSSTIRSLEGECCYTVKFAGDATYAPDSSGVWALIGKVALTSPANASLVTDELPWLNWFAYTDFYGTGSETKYHIQVATAPTFGTTIIYDTDVDGYLTFPIPSPLIMGKTYYWHVLSYVLYGRSKYSNTWSFTYKGGTSISPQLLSQDGQKATLIAKLTDGSGGPLSGKTVFFYEGATLKAYGTTGADGSYRATITSPVGSHTYTAKFNGDAYYAPAAPADVPVVIGKVVLSSPAMGAVVTTATPTLSWVAYSGDTTKYHVQVSSSSTFAAGTFKLDSDTVGAETSITPSALTRGVTYYWRVTAILPTGSSVWSDYRTIVYKAGTIISISAPVSVVGSKVTVTVTLTDASSNKLYGKTLTFYDEAIGASAYTIRGTAVTAGAASTNPPPGEAVKSWTLLAAPEPGTRQVKVAFAGDSNYLPATVTMGYPRPNGGNIMAIGVSPGYSTDSTLFAGTATGNIFKSVNGGASWSVVNSSGQAIRTIALSPNYTTDQTLLVGTDGGVLKSSNGGSSWNAENTGISNLYIQALAISPNYSVDQTMFAGTNSGGAYKSVNGGSSWTAIGTMSYISVLAISPGFANDQILYAAGTLGVYKSRDGGASWTTLSTPSSAYMALALSPNYAADHTVYAGAYDGAGIIKSTDDGVSWNTVYSTLYVESLAISPNYVNDNSIYAGCQNGVGVLKSTDGGASWSASNNGLLSSYVTSLAISPGYASDGTLFAGTSSGGLYNGVYKSTNGAASWGAVY